MLRQLIDVIKHQTRFALQEPYSSFINSIVTTICEKFTSEIKAGSKLYRARINKINFDKKEQEKSPFPPFEMGAPPYLLASSGRINPEGIPYLYCAEEIDTAGAELRPWHGAYLTIAEIIIQSNIIIADLTKECQVQDWSLFFYDFADLFSIQWPPELKLNYLVTQYFSEQFKSRSLHGIKYKSVYNVGGNNLALFHKNDYIIAKTYTVEATDINYFFYKHNKERKAQGAGLHS